MLPIQRKRWTPEEEKSVLDGVSEFGIGCWAKIQCKYFPQHSSSRTQTDIKDKYRNMTDYTRRGCNRKEDERKGRVSPEAVTSAVL